VQFRTLPSRLVPPALGIVISVHQRLFSFLMLAIFHHISYALYTSCAAIFPTNPRAAGTTVHDRQIDHPLALFTQAGPAFLSFASKLALLGDAFTHHRRHL
jgi:hypothetical protein